MEELCSAMLELLTKPYEYHMIDFLCDAENYFGMTEQDFARWDDKVLLILSEDDITFNQACKAVSYTHLDVYKRQQKHRTP